MESEKEVRLVERGYNKIYKAYAAERTDEHGFSRNMVFDLSKRLKAGAKVLDAGCGNGYTTKILVKAGFSVVGTDISSNMLKLAKKDVPKARFYRMDMRRLRFPKASFDAITCFYAIIHVPKRYHLQVLKSFNAVLGPGGYLLISMGLYASKPEPDIGSDWLGAPMYWSHYGQKKNLELIRSAGFRILWKKAERGPVPKWDRHLYILAQKR